MAGESGLKVLECEHIKITVNKERTEGYCSTCETVITGSNLVRVLIKIVEVTNDRLEESEQLRKEQATPTFSRECVRSIGAIMNAFPFPAWVHPVKTMDWYLNDAYCERFTVARLSFCTPVNILSIYPTDLAAGFVQEDMAVIRANRRLVLPADLICRKIMDPPGTDNQGEMVEVVKSPILILGEPCIFGAAYPEGVSALTGLKDS